MPQLPPASRSRKLAVALACVLCLLPVQALVAHAQPAGEAVLWLAFDGAGQSTNTTIVPFAPFTLYAVVDGVDEISAIELSQQFPAAVIALGQSYVVPGALNIGLADNPIVGLGQCFQPPAGRSWIVQTELLYAATPVANDLLFCPGASTPSSVQGLGPAYVDCNDQLFLLGSFDSTGSSGFYPEGCAVGNPSIVATETTSWGRVKLGGH